MALIQNKNCTILQVINIILIQLVIDITLKQM